MASFLPFAGVGRRTACLRGILLGACFLSLIASAPVWRNGRMFPLLPIAQWFPILPSPWDTVLFLAMIAALVLAMWLYRSAVTFFLVASLFAYCEDQNRGQPWFYMYWVMLGMTLLPENIAMAACRMGMSIAYLWSGIQKCHPKFFNVVPGWFVGPAAGWHLPGAVVELLKWAVATAPFVEIAIGVALWFPRLRMTAIAAAVLVHGTALIFLGPLGYNYDWVVWPWNLAMPALLWVTGGVRKGELPTSNFQLRTSNFRQTLAELRRSRVAVVLVALYGWLPVLSYAGWWDSYFSFTLFAESQAKADIYVTEALRDRLPRELQDHVHKLRQAYDPRLQGPYVFDFQTWGYKELHVPPIFEPRNFRSIYRYLQKWAREPGDLRLMVAARGGAVWFYEGERRERLGR